MRDYSKYCDKNFMEYFGTEMSVHDDSKNTEYIKSNIKSCLHSRHEKDENIARENGQFVLISGPINY